MTNNVTIDPETARLKAEIESLRKKFIELYTKKEEMTGVEQDDLYVRYVELIGKAKYENFRLSIIVKALKMKTELAQAALNRNEKPNIHEIERQVDNQLKEYYKIIEEQAAAVKQAQDAALVNDFDINEERDLYHVLVKRLHPDLHPNQPDKMTDLFIKGQAAYKMHNIALLREIVMRLDVESDVDDLLLKSDTSLEDEIKRLNEQIAEIERDIETLESSFPFTLRENLKDGAWVQQQQDELKSEYEQLKEEEKTYAERLSLLTDI